MGTAIYVDVDDTLIRSVGTKRVPLPHMVSLVRRLFESGATLYCWSTGGAVYARSSAEEVGLVDCFAAFLPKPHVLLDDVRLDQWKLTQLHPAECSSLGAEDVLAKVKR